MNNLKKSIEDFLDENTKLRAQLSEAQSYKADAERFNYIMDDKLEFSENLLKELFELKYSCTKERAIKAIDQAMKENNATTI